MSCSVNISPKTISRMMGGQNCHVEVVFADGVVWLARIKLSSAIAPPPEVRDYVLQSEAATMLFLQHHTRIPSPRLYDWACASDPANAVGVGYLLMEKLSGVPLDWQSPTMTATQREKIVRQYADVMVELARHPFDKFGSLMTVQKDRGEETTSCPLLVIQELAQHSTFRTGLDGGPMGPFSSSRQAVQDIVTAHLEKIAAGELGRADNAVDVFLTHRFRLDVLDSLWPDTQTADSAPSDEQFFLKHADDKGDHILVNADYDIVGILDWEWCSTASRDEAFSSPCMMWPVAAFYDGSNVLTNEERLLARVLCEEKGRADLADCVLQGRRVQRLMFALGPGGTALEDRLTFLGLFMGLYEAFVPLPDGEEAEKTDEDAGRQERQEQQWGAWKEKALGQWQLEGLMQKVLYGDIVSGRCDDRRRDRRSKSEERQNE